MKSLVFDMDGTLLDSQYTIFSAAAYALEKVGATGTFTFEDLKPRIGAHFMDMFDEVGVSVPDTEAFFTVYKKQYFADIDKTVFYPHVLETLDVLVKQGYILSLLTTKAQDQTEKIIDRFGLRPFFTKIVGRRDRLALKPAPDGLLSICNSLQISPAHTLMIGDSEFDIRCGKNAFTLTCAVSYGYRGKQFLADEKPDFLIDSIDMLPDLLA